MIPVACSRCSSTLPNRSLHAGHFAGPDTIPPIRRARRHTPAFVAELIDALARFGWVAFPRGDEFGLIQKSAIAGWVRIGTKRVMDDQRALRNMKKEERGKLFAEMQAGLQDLLPSDGEEDE
ncbi:hypothetical protein [Rhodoblastus sp.]|uniref:hypothetical protein n=1 Tax=Rhodoblastus sp. TaxID=1962975 RepID=UPI003F9E2C51